MFLFSLDCKPIQIWMLIRHGTRNPAKGEIKGMKHDLPELQRRIIENHEQYGSKYVFRKRLSINS